MIQIPKEIEGNRLSYEEIIKLGSGLGVWIEHLQKRVEEQQVIIDGLFDVLCESIVQQEKLKMVWWELRKESSNKKNQLMSNRVLELESVQSSHTFLLPDLIKRLNILEKGFGNKNSRHNEPF